MGRIPGSILASFRPEAVEDRLCHLCKKTIDESQMPNTPEHAFTEKSTKLLILPSLRTIYNRTFQCETPCNIRKLGLEVT